MAIEMNKIEIIFNKTLYVGIAILEIFKTYFYTFYYYFMSKNNSCKLLYTHTDSLIIEKIIYLKIFIIVRCISFVLVFVEPSAKYNYFLNEFIYFGENV